MLVFKGHKILLETIQEQDDLFTSWCGAARWTYNAGLEYKIALYRDKKKSIGAYALMKEIVALKQTPEYGWLNDVPSSIPRRALLQLDVAYENFFRRMKQGKTEKGFPRFKGKKNGKLSFHIAPDSIAIEYKRVRIPKIGWLKMYQSVRFSGKIVGTVCISKTAGRWYASFNIETEIPDPSDNQASKVTGLDVGIKTLATLSDGMEFANPKASYRLANLLTRAQRQMARKQKGSKRWEKAKLRVQRIHKRITDVRANATHNVSAYVVKHYSGVAIEDLNVDGMVKNHHLAKSIMDANFSELHRQLQYKMAWSGGEVRQVDRWFPSSRLCRSCGTINDKLTLADREWDCVCGAHHHRDQNAAQNLEYKCWPPV